VTELRDLATRGELAAAYAAATAGRARTLRAAAYAVTHQVVYDVLTRRIEHERGHARCAQGIQRLEAACLDRYYDDVEAAVRHLLHRAKQPIRNVESWVVGAARTAAMDGNRMRRGERGALQRPRTTRTLEAGLEHDPWLLDLALHILEWVGVTATAGAGLWPLESWAELRSKVKGDMAAADPKVVAEEVERVLAVMRRQPMWYADYVERPLGRKVAPVGGSPGDEVVDPWALELVRPDEVDDSRLRDLAWTMREAIRLRLRGAADPAQVVREVLAVVFLDGTGSDELGRMPGTGSSHAEHVSALLADPVALDRVMVRVLRVLGHVQE
jgi:hypothetical protein